ncbi:hypothetical protein C8A00DRAFT_14945 [Chaetomidium leptoderma]|uniref:BTB domain-containing protein n=1 Tax=Chaetomidium leptoderma TaxID=669021 RepID=A0AAN6VM96_9PEZI|nr:hypothetical protein C8A00DRAFT_14945 [Chaetomidium leptoderma]
MTDGSQSSQPARATGTSSSSEELQGLDSWLTERIVTVTIGPDEKRWVVHEKLLVSQSDFFRDHFASGEEELKLPDDEPKLFALFIRWLYGTAFLPSGGTRNFRFMAPDDDKNLTVRDYLGVYVMGGKFGIVGVRNAVIDVLYAHYGEADDGHMSPNLHDVTYVFENTAREAPMRRFLVAHALFYLFSKNRRDAPLPEDWVEVLNTQSEIGFEMINMLGEWNWSMGHNAPRMTIKPRIKFHERLPQPEEMVKQEEVEDAIPL